jgi:hypothetical protein
MSNSNNLLAATIGDYLSRLTFYEALIVTDLFSWRPFKDSEDGVSLCHCSPHNEACYDDLCAVLRGLRDVASSLKFRFVFYEVQDDSSFGIPMDIIRVGMSVDFYTFFSQFLAEYMKSPVFHK